MNFSSVCKVFFSNPGVTGTPITGNVLQKFVTQLYDILVNFSEF